MKHLSALILLAAATAFTASAQTVMKVKMTSGETTEIPVGKIENVTFGETSEPEQPEAGRPVDLGLSVLWADRNVGATSEFDPGIQCGWGDPTGEKAEVSRASYDFSDDLRRFQWGVQVGAEWQAYKHLSVYADLTWGINSIFPKDFESISFAMYPVYLNAGFSYLF